MSVQLSLAAGGYVIFGKAQAYNSGSAGANLDCRLVNAATDSSGGSNYYDTAGNYVAVGGYATDAVVAALNLTSTTTIRMKCGKSSTLLPGEMQLHAIKVALH